MARPIKEGVDYFPLDVHLDTKFELIEAEYGLIGFAVVVKLFQRIYSEFGYYCEWTNEVALLFGKSVGLGYNAVSEIVSASIKRGIFDKDKLDAYCILTSSGIQKRYFEMVSRRNIINVKNEYLLVQVDQNKINVTHNEVNVCNNSENDNDNTQSKVKERKGKKSKKDICPAEPNPVHEIIDYLNMICGTAFKSTTKATQNHINARLAEGFAIDDFKTIIDKKYFEWGKKPDMVQYLRPETLFCAKHFESYLNQPFIGDISDKDVKLIKSVRENKEAEYPEEWFTNGEGVKLD